MKDKHNISYSSSFRKSVIQATFAILFFILIYLSLIFFSIVLLAISLYAGVFLMTEVGNLFTGIIGIGIISIGVMFFLFLLKFIFTRYKDENPYRIRISAKQYPALFEALKEVSKRVGSRAPRKVYVSNNVNALVFYNSSFLSLFLPVRKNLEIGLGLINSLNVSEFKSILAHEFGHFSQKSMRLGTYVYIVNNVIFNIVNHYGRIDQILEGFIEARNMFSIFPKITYFLINQVRGILRETYNVVNISYLKLSRETEFHADSIAASCYGAESFTSALRRIEFGDMAFNQTLSSLHGLSQDGKYSENVFENHLDDIRDLSDYFNLDTNDNLPIISDNDLEINLSKPRVTFKDKWASHPQREEREKNISNYLNHGSAIEDKPAWLLVNDAISLQKSITKQMYTVDLGDLSNMESISIEEYERRKTANKGKYSISKVFKKYYDNRLLHITDINKIENGKLVGELEHVFESIYSKKSAIKFEKLQLNQNDLYSLQNIKDKVIKTNYFEFDGTRYKRKEVDKAIKLLQSETEILANEIKEMDTKSFILNSHVAKKVDSRTQNEYINKVKQLKKAQARLKDHIDHLEKLSLFQNTIYSKTQWKEDESNQFIRGLSKFEKTYKKFLNELKVTSSKTVTGDLKSLLESYLENSTYYISSVTFNFDKFNEFFNLVNEVNGVLGEDYSQIVKDITDVQVENLKLSKVNSC